MKSMMWVPAIVRYVGVRLLDSSSAGNRSSHYDDVISWLLNTKGHMLLY